MMPILLFASHKQPGFVEGSFFFFEDTSNGILDNRTHHRPGIDHVVFVGSKFFPYRLFFQKQVKISSEPVEHFIVDSMNHTRSKLGDASRNGNTHAAIEPGLPLFGFVKIHRHFHGCAALALLVAPPTFDSEMVIDVIQFGEFHLPIKIGGNRSYFDFDFPPVFILSQ